MESSQLASYLASRIFHDLASPLTALMHGCSVAFEEEMGLSMKAEGERLIKDGVNRMAAKIQFMRFALGSQEVNDHASDVPRARQLFEILLDAHRQHLDWTVETERLTNRQMRLLMNMGLMAMEATGKEGRVAVTVREEGDRIVMETAYTGKSELRQDVRDALQGRTPEQGWGGGAIQPLFARLLADQIGATLEFQPGEGGGALVARMAIAA